MIDIRIKGRTYEDVVAQVVAMFPQVKQEVRCCATSTNDPEHPPEIRDIRGDVFDESLHLTEPDGTPAYTGRGAFRKRPKAKQNADAPKGENEEQATPPGFNVYDYAGTMVANSLSSDDFQKHIIAFLEDSTGETQVARLARNNSVDMSKMKDLAPAVHTAIVEAQVVALKRITNARLKENAEKENAEKENAEKENAEKENAEKENAEKEKALLTATPRSSLTTKPIVVRDDRGEKLAVVGTLAEAVGVWSKWMEHAEKEGSVSAMKFNNKQFLDMVAGHPENKAVVGAAYNDALTRIRGGITQKQPKTVTEVDDMALVAAMSGLISTKGVTFSKSMLDRYGVHRVKELPQEKRTEFMAETATILGVD